MSYITKNIDIDESADAVIAGPAHLLSIQAVNLHTAPLHLKLYDGSPTVGTTVPKLTITVPSAGTANGGQVSHNWSGIKFNTGIYVAGTTGVADNDTGAPGANLLIANIEWN